MPVTYSSPELRFDTVEEKKFALVARCTEKLRAKGLELVTVDGVRATWPDGWGLIRASNTTPILVVRYEAKIEGAAGGDPDADRRHHPRGEAGAGRLMSFSLGVDIGGTTARAAVVDRDTGRIVASEKETWTERSLAAVVAGTAELVNSLARAHPLATGLVGVGFAGMLRGPVVVNAPNLGWREVDFGTPLASALGRPVKLVNDLSAAAWGEYSAGAAKGATDSFTVFVGTGVGSAIISGGALVKGANQVAGEFGHVKLLAQGGRRCGCGQDGCLEAYTGGARLAEWMKEEGLAGGAVDLEVLAASGDATAKRLYEFSASALALAIANQVTVLNPGVLVLGGGVLSRCPGLVERIRQAVSTRATATASSVRVAMAVLGDDSGLVGAALLS